MIYLTRRSDRTIFFSSHQLADVERVADYVAVLDHSVLRACCSLETFRNTVQQVRLRFTGAPPPLPKIPGLLQAFREADELRLTACITTEHRAGAAGPVASGNGTGSDFARRHVHQLPG